MCRYIDDIAPAHSDADSDDEDSGNVYYDNQEANSSRRALSGMYSSVAEAPALVGPQPHGQDQHQSLDGDFAANSWDNGIARARNLNSSVRTHEDINSFRPLTISN